MAESLLEVRSLTRQFGAVTANDRIDLSIEAGECHAVIGPNGAGKTTLVAQLAGMLAPSSGAVRLGGRDITGLPDYRRVHLGLARSFQITSLFKDFTVHENVAIAAQGRRAHSFQIWRRADRDRDLIAAAEPILNSAASLGKQRCLLDP